MAVMGYPEENEVISSSETVVPTYQSGWCPFPEELNLHMKINSFQRMYSNLFFSSFTSYSMFS
jgi:hypothetical protein